jgi:hypothetical protein
VLASVQLLFDAYRARATALLEGQAHSAAPESETHLNLSLALTTRVAWDVARLAGALALMPRDVLGPYAAAFQMQDLWERDRSFLLDLAMQLELLDLPADHAQAAVLDERLRLLTRARSVLRYHLGLADGLLASYGRALGEPKGAAA